jgi:hypothetical protein
MSWVVDEGPREKAAVARVPTPATPALRMSWVVDEGPREKAAVALAAPAAPPAAPPASGAASASAAAGAQRERRRGGRARGLPGAADDEVARTKGALRVRLPGWRGENSRLYRALLGAPAPLTLEPGGKALRVEGALRLGGMDITALPAGALEVRGSLVLRGCRRLAAMPDWLAVHGDLDLRACSSLVRLPQHVEVHGSLLVEDCEALEVLPLELVVRGDADLRGIGAVATLPVQLEVGGDLKIRYAERLRELPELLRVGGSVVVAAAPLLEALPSSLTLVRGSLELSECGLRALPPGLSVLGDLDLTGCAQLAALPRALHVQEDLFLVGCENLRFGPVPEGLNVGGAIFGVYLEELRWLSYAAALLAEPSVAAMANEWASRFDAPLRLAARVARGPRIDAAVAVFARAAALAFAPEAFRDARWLPPGSKGCSDHERALACVFAGKQLVESLERALVAALTARASSLNPL